MPVDNPEALKTAKFKFGQPWTHRGVTYKAGDEPELSADDARMLTEMKAHEAAKPPAKPSK